MRPVSRFRTPADAVPAFLHQRIAVFLISRSEVEIATRYQAV